MAGPRVWALVSNGVRARILRGLGDGSHVEPIELISKAALNHLREAVADKGTAAEKGNGMSGRGSPASDPIRSDMLDFARDMLALLERHHRAGDFDWLAIVAPPEMLDILRRELSATMRPSVVLDHPQNLIRLPTAELRATVRRMLPDVSA